MSYATDNAKVALIVFTFCAPRVASGSLGRVSRLLMGSAAPAGAT
jgi:hypothetical protein